SLMSRMIMQVLGVPSGSWKTTDDTSIGKSAPPFRRPVSSPWAIPVFANGDQNFQPRIGSVNQALPALLPDFIGSAAEDSTGGGISLRGPIRPSRSASDHRGRCETAGRRAVRRSVNYDLFLFPVAY